MFKVLYIQIHLSHVLHADIATPLLYVASKENVFSGSSCANVPNSTHFFDIFSDLTKHLVGDYNGIESLMNTGNSHRYKRISPTVEDFSIILMLP
jgi:hypothetical protein